MGRRVITVFSAKTTLYELMMTFPEGVDKLTECWTGEGANMWSQNFTAFPGIAIVMVLAIGQPAAADDRETCKNSSGDVAIEACSSAIKSGKFKGRNLSLLYTNRGVEYVGKEDVDRGIADHDQAIKLDPKNSLA